MLSPGLRVGFMCANKELIQKAVVIKQTSDVHSNILAQMICDKFLTQYDFDEHVKNLREIYRHKCSLMLTEMEKRLNPKITYVKPEGGLFIWCTLPDGVDMLDFCTKCVQNNVAVVPGSAFMPTEKDKTQSFRINFSTPTDEQIVKGIELLGKLSNEIL